MVGLPGTLYLPLTSAIAVAVQNHGRRRRWARKSVRLGEQVAEARGVRTPAGRVNWQTRSSVEIAGRLSAGQLRAGRDQDPGDRPPAGPPATPTVATLATVGAPRLSGRTRRLHWAPMPATDPHKQPPAERLARVMAAIDGRPWENHAAPGASRFVRDLAHDGRSVARCWRWMSGFVRSAPIDRRAHCIRHVGHAGPQRVGRQGR
jgi:hypothetical protein